MRFGLVGTGFRETRGGQRESLVFPHFLSVASTVALNQSVENPVSLKRQTDGRARVRAIHNIQTASPAARRDTPD